MVRDGMELRPCRDEDIEAVLSLWARSTAPRASDTAEAIALRLERDRELFILAWDGLKLVASVIGGWDGWRGNIYRLAVEPEYRRMGLGRQLVELVELRLRAMGARRMTALVLIDEPGATEFWGSAGYAHDPDTERYAKDLG
ncbi:MAG: GNAT family N-acetyltransferase [Dehalococcoidia bacterium]|jgi:ribosomal protein S18 acetylase RimI-like enzyme|nr:GNAT family N-acetyltransferase [Dehalococcoidia bacterium]